jgi:hypothetical protein
MRTSAAQPKRTTARTASSKKRLPDAIAVLKADHAAVKKLYRRFEALAEDGASAKERSKLAEQICSELELHAKLEEEIFYPAARAAEIDDDLLNEAEVEHASAKDLIAQIRAGSPTDPLFDAKVIVLCEYVDHHVKEEEKELFPKCRKSDMDLRALGEAMAVRKVELGK